MLEKSERAIKIELSRGINNIGRKIANKDKQNIKNTTLKTKEMRNTDPSKPIYKLKPEIPRYRKCNF